MLEVRRLTVGEIAQLRRHGYDEITVMNVAVTRDLSHWLGTLRIPFVQPPSIVRSAQLTGIGIPVATVDAALEVHLPPEWPIGTHITQADPSLVMTVTPTT